MYVLCAHTLRGELRNVTGWMQAHVCAKTSRIHSSVNDVISRETTLDWTDETDCVSYGDKCSMPAGTLLRQKQTLCKHLLFGGEFSTEQRVFCFFLSPQGLISHCFCVIQQAGIPELCIYSSLCKKKLFSSDKNLTHFLGQQVNILFVASLGGIVQLYQSQSLGTDTSVIHIQTTTYFSASLLVINTNK